MYLTQSQKQSKLGVNWPQLNYHPVQHALWVCPKRFVYVPCGRQSGKSELAMRRLVRYLPIKRDWPDPRFFYGGPTYQWLKRTVWRRLLNLIPQHWIEDISISELTVRTIFGSEFFLLGLDRPERAEGLILDGGIIDENSHIKPKTFDLSVLPTLTWRKGWTWFIGVPRRFGVGVVEYKERYDKAVAGTLPDSAGFTWPSEGVIPADRLEYMQATMDERDYAEQYEASWLSPGGGVFHNFDREYNVRRDDEIKYNPDKVVLVGSDFNVNPMCWVFCHLNGNTLEVFDELFLRHTNTPAALKVFLTRFRDHKGHFQLYGDASAKAAHTSATQSDLAHIMNNEQLKALVRTKHYLKGNPHVADRFAATNAKICCGDGTVRLFIAERCTHLINDLEIRTYKLGTRKPDDHDDIGHPSDALSYICYRKWPILTRISGGGQIITMKKGS